MYPLQIQLLFLLGLLLGSFYNVVGLRLPIKESFTNDRSRCPACKQTLLWYELIPVLSFVFQSGKCLHCKTSISPIYPIIESFTGFLFAYSLIKVGMQIELLIIILFISMLMIVLVTDITYMLIPNKVLLFFFPLFIILRLIEPLDPWWSALLGSFIGFILILIIIMLSRGGMGAGDMKLLAISGIVLGMEEVLLTFFIASMIGSIVGMILLHLKWINRNEPVPFGPYIVIAALLTYFHGDQIIHWYYSFF